jgi:quercetin 2,3-dioxygenase
MSIRPVKRHTASRPTLEGAGVHLHRAFGFDETNDVDPFLLLDDFRNDVPADYRAGFPWHPHRGIETITYVLAGTVDHADSLGNAGAIGPGDVQWMTAGRGIVHQEMPHGDPLGRMHGFQLWANLPATQKMTAPRYQEVAARDVTEVTDDDGTHVRVICGEFWGRRGPVEGVAADPQYLDITVPPNVARTIPVLRSKNVFAYVFDGDGRFRDASAPRPVVTDMVADGPTRRRLGDTRHRRRQPFADRVRCRRRDPRACRRTRSALPARLGRADSRADRLARTRGDELAGGAAAGVRTAPQRHVPRHPLVFRSRSPVTHRESRCARPAKRDD